MPNSFPRERLEQPQQFVQRTLEKEHTESPATEKKMWDSIMTKGEKHVNKIGYNGGMARYISTFNLLISYEEEKDHL